MKKKEKRREGKELESTEERLIRSGNLDGIL